MVDKPIQMSMADKILNMNDDRTEIVTVPEWDNMKVLCKNISGSDRAILARMLIVDSNTNKVTTKSTSADIVVMGAYNPETGDRIFSESQKIALLAKNSAPLERLAVVIQKLSGLSSESVEEAEKN
jgi:hypothetical protein